MNQSRIDRRTLIKMTGATLLLPALPALSEAAEHASVKRPPRRLCAIFFGNGVSLPPVGHKDHEDWHWFPNGRGRDFVLTKTLASLAPLRNQFSILGGLSHPILRSIYAHNTAGFFLTGADERGPTGNTVSVDQVFAHHEGIHTRYPSLTLASEGGIGNYRNSRTLSFNYTGQPIPPIATPRAVYNELFAIDSRGKNARLRAFGKDRSILDGAIIELKAVQGKLNSSDKGRLEQYLTAVRAMEQRIDRAEAWMHVEKKPAPASRFDLDADPRHGPEAFLDSMYDLVHAAFLTDSTRSIAFMKAREGIGGISGNFPKALGLPGHHELSHSTQSENGYANWGRYDQFLAERFSAFLTKMANTDDPIAQGSLLDNTIVLYGSGTSLTHTTYNYPVILAGGRNFGLSHGQFHDFHVDGEDTPFNNLLLTLLVQLGTEVDRFGDSTGTLSELLS